MYSLIRSLLFKIDAEKVHHMVMKWLTMACSIGFLRGIIKSLFVMKHPDLETTVFGITFPNPVGLAAGFDKDAKYTDSLACLGFGFIEIGTVTQAPPGQRRRNSRPSITASPARISPSPTRCRVSSLSPSTSQPRPAAEIGIRKVTSDNAVAPALARMRKAIR